MDKAPRLPPRWPLIRRFLYLARLAGVDDWRQWSTDLLGKPVTSHWVLTKQDAQDLIDELVLNGDETRACRSLNPDNDASCIHDWPGHPLLCCDEWGHEWLAREV